MHYVDSAEGKIAGIQEVIARTEISHTKPELNATKCIRATVTEQKQQEVCETERIYGKP